MPSRFEELFAATESPKPLPKGGDSSASLESLFEEIPAGLDVFIQDNKYLGIKGFRPSDIQSDLIHHVERIYYPNLYPQLAEHDRYWAKPIRQTNFHVAQWGKGSGKDSSIRFAFLRVAYLYMCLKEPQLYYGMPEDDDVHMLNVAISSTQAQNAFFNPLKKNIRRGYFKDRAESTMGQITFDKGLIGVSGHSRAESQEGLNLLFGVCDEIDGFKTKAEIAKTRGSSVRDSENTAEHIMNMMKSSSTTRFPQVFKQVYISYPRYLGSTIQDLTDKGRKDIAEEGAASQWYVSGPYATWDVKPSASKRDFWDEYKKDPIEAAAKYECKPRHAADPYYKNILAVEACMREEEEPAVQVEYYTDGTTWTPKFIFRNDFYPIVGAKYAMHADMATKGDRAGIAMSHITHQDSVTKTVEGEKGEFIEVTEQEAYVKTDFVLAIEADISVECVPPREIQMRWARDLWAELQLRGFHIPQFSFDGYQSLESRQGLEALGVKSPLISTDKSEDPWKLLRDLMEGTRIDIPKHLVLTTELLGLTKKPNGKVDHTTFSGKDLADALACSATGAIMVGGSEDPSGARAYYTRPEFLMGHNKAPEMSMIQDDPFNFGTEGFDFHTEVSGYGWDQNGGMGDWL